MKNIINWGIFVALMMLASFFMRFDLPDLISNFVFSLTISYGLYLLLFKNHLYPYNFFGFIIAVIGTMIILYFDNTIITWLVIFITLICDFKAPKR